MTSIPLPANPTIAGNLRPLNILRDLPRVADLIELCFANNMDREGKSYIQQMRRASRDKSFMRWASNAIEGTAMPLTGYVWEQDGRIIGNASLVPFRYKGKRIQLIANVATHPEHRRRGIARALTTQAMLHAGQRGTDELWLHVRADNPGAVQMYRDLGFEERAQRSIWRAYQDPASSSPLHSDPIQTPNPPTISRRHPSFWSQQLNWLNKLHPEELHWYRSINWNSLKPGLGSWLYRLFVEYDIRQWAVRENGNLQAVLAWIPTLRNSSMWLACDSNASPSSISTLLRKAMRDLGKRQNLTLEHPAGLQEEALSTAGFKLVRTLIWMYVNSAT